MSLSGIDTSQLSARFASSESQQEWADVREALLEAFPGQSMEELQAAATAVLTRMPDLGIDDLVMVLGTEFGVDVTAANASAIRTEWEEFNQASGLSPAELMEVLDDYSGDGVDTKSQKYMLLLMKLLRQELSILASEGEEADLEAEKSKLEADMADMVEEAGEERTTQETLMQWMGAACAVAAAAAAVTLAVVGSTLTLGLGAGILGPAAVSMCLFAASAVASAATGEDYSLATVASGILQWMGVPEDTADVLGVIFEVGHVVQAFIVAGPLVVMAEAPRLLSLVNDAIESLFASSGEGGETDGTQGAEFSEAELQQYEFNDGEMASLKEAVAQMTKMLKSGQAVNAAMLDAIFNAMSGGMSDKGSALIDMMLGSSEPSMA